MSWEEKFKGLYSEVAHMLCKHQDDNGKDIRSRGLLHKWDSIRNKYSWDES